MKPIDRIKLRLSQQEDMEPIREKAHRLRLLVAGDKSPLGGVQQAWRPSDGDDWGQYYRALVRELDSGHGNELAKQVRTMVMTTGYQMPRVSFESLPSEAALFHEAYLGVRLGPRPKGCEAMDACNNALMESLITGLGWAMVDVVDDRPIIRHVDALDVTWDPTAPDLRGIGWAAVVVRAPRHQWEKIFGEKAVGEAFARSAEATDDTRDLWMQYYWDTEDDRGHHVVWPIDASRTLLGDKPIYAGDNPYYLMLGKRTIPFLPLEPHYYQRIPGTIVPSGMVEAMLPNQVELWMIERRDQLTLQRGAPFYRKRGMGWTPEQLQAFEAGDIGSVVDIPADGDLDLVPGLEVTQTQQTLRQYHEAKISEHSGASPYASGSVPSVQFATESAMIGQTADLVSQYVATQHAKFMERLFRKFIAAASLYDDAELEFYLDGVELYFDAATPVGQFLVPGEDLVVREDTMRYEPQDAKIARASALLEQSMALQMMAPNAPLKAFEEILRAHGKRDAAEWLAPPTMSDMGMGVPAQDAEAQAQATTQS